MKFTERYIKNLKPEPADLPVRYYQREAHGFAIRVQPSGLKTWFFIYTLNGKRQHLNLGNYPAVTLQEAHQKYSEAFNKLGRGENPNKPKAEETTEEPLTFEHFAKLYLANAEKNLSPSWYKTLSMSLANDVTPAWGDKPIDSIKRRDAITLLERISDRAPGQAKNVHKAARAVFTYAIQRDYIEANPLYKLSSIVPSLKPVAKKRVLSDKELATVWKALDSGSGNQRTKNAIKLILVTAQRPGEVANMHRNQIEGNWWTLQAESVKNNETHRVYLTPTALKLIGDTEQGYIFPSGKLDDNEQPRPIVRQTLSQTVVSLKYCNIPNWTPHDLRRTARTLLARLGIRDEHAEAILNHKKQGVVKVYNLHEYEKEKEEAMLLWEAELLRLVS